MKHELTSAIKPTYVTFEQAKLLKEKGFDLRIKQWYVSKETILFLYDEDNTLGWCNRNLPKNEYSAPEQWQVVEWLRIKHGVWILALPTINGYFAYKIIDVQMNPEKHIERPPYKDVSANDYKTPQEAYSAAFDYILTNLI